MKILIRYYFSYPHWQVVCYW